MNRILHWSFYVLLVICIAGVTYMLAVQYTKVNSWNQLFVLIIPLLPLGVIGGLMFLAIHINSKGITLLFLSEVINQLHEIFTFVWTQRDINITILTPTVMAITIINITFYCMVPILYILGIYILYKEYKAGELIHVK